MTSLRELNPPSEDCMPIRGFENKGWIARSISFSREEN
jgi:hypothetical protein